MRRCDDCRIIVDRDASYCPQCGKRIDDTPADIRGGSTEVGALLTSANLHRVRGEYEEAARDAARALGLEPENAEIAALLGMIYEQRGMPEEAAVWYRMAIRLDPTNSANRARLERAEAAVARRQGHPGRMRGLWIAAAAVVLIAAVLVLFVWRGASKPPPAEPTVASERAGAETAQQESETIPAPAQPPVSAAGPTSPAGVGGGLRTPGELKVRSEAAAAQRVRELRVSVDDVLADPRHGTVFVTFSTPAGSPVTRSSIINAAAAVAEAAFASSTEVNTVTARCLINEPALGGTQIGFVGDVVRGAIEALGEQPTAEQLQTAFRNVWWNPNVPQR